MKSKSFNRHTVYRNCAGLDQYADLSAPSKVNQSHFNSGAIPYFKLWWREAFIFRKRFSPKFLWSSALCWGFSNWFQIIYGRVNHLMTSINNATFQLRAAKQKIQRIEDSKKWYQTQHSQSVPRKTKRLPSSLLIHPDCWEDWLE